MNGSFKKGWLLMIMTTALHSSCRLRPLLSDKNTNERSPSQGASQEEFSLTGSGVLHFDRVNSDASSGLSLTQLVAPAAGTNVFFGAQVVPNTGRLYTIFFTSTGSAALTFGTLGTMPAPFSYVTSLTSTETGAWPRCTTGLVLATGKKCYYSLLFLPPTAGAYFAQQSLTYSGGGVVKSSTLYLEGHSVNSGSQNFTYSTEVGKPIDITIRVDPYGFKNTNGVEGNVIKSATNLTAPFSYKTSNTFAGQGANPCHFDEFIPFGSTCNLNLEYNPTSPGPHQVDVELTGTGYSGTSSWKSNSHINAFAYAPGHCEKTHRYYRLRVLSLYTDSYLQGAFVIPEIQVAELKDGVTSYLSNTMTSALAGKIGSHPVSISHSSSLVPNHEGWRAFDGNGSLIDPNTAWISAFGTFRTSSPFDSVNPIGEFVTLDFGPDAANWPLLTGYRVYSYYDAKYLTDSWALDGSADGSTWSEIEAARHLCEEVSFGNFLEKTWSASAAMCPAPTATPSPTPSLTPTPIVSVTPVATSTPTTPVTLTPTNTVTNVPTSTATSTSTSTPSATNTATAVPTNTLTNTNTPTFTAIPTFTSTSTSTRTATPTATPTCGTRRSLSSMNIGETLFASQTALTAVGTGANCTFNAVLQGDGDFVLYRNKQALWRSGAAGAGAKLVFQGDGNLVNYRANGTAKWNSVTVKKGGIKVGVYGNGQLKMTNAAGAVVWSAGRAIAGCTHVVPAPSDGGSCVGPPTPTPTPTQTPTRTPTRTPTPYPKQSCSMYVVLRNAFTTKELYVFIPKKNFIGLTLNQATLGSIVECRRNINIFNKDDPANRSCIYKGNTYQLMTGAAFGSPECPATINSAQSPLILNLSPGKIQLTPPDQGVAFDLTGEGQANKWSWPANAAIAPFLVLPAPGDRAVINIQQLFGNNTVGPDGKKAANGFEALRKYDVDGDKAITPKDPIFAKLRLWADGNKDGAAASEELATLASAGITSISLRYVTGDDRLDFYGNFSKEKASVTLNSGKSATMEDVWFVPGN